MSAAASCKGAAEKESSPCLQCPSDTQNPGVKGSIGLCAKVAKVESGNDNARSDDDDDDSNVGCGDKLNPASRVDKIFISPDGVEF